MTSPAAASIVMDSQVSTIPSVFSSVQAVGGAWMLSSALLTTYSTTRYLKFKDPPHLEKLAKQSKTSLSRATLLTIFRFSGSLILGLVAHPNLNIIDRVQETWALVPPFALPALFLFIANYTNTISLNRIGISLTYTSKCAIPLVTLALTLLLDGVEALPSIPVLLTLVPIALGIGTASWNHPTFEKFGFLAALTSCTAQSALNVTCKRTMSKLGVAGPVAQRTMVAVGLVIASSFTLLQASSQKQVKELVDYHPPSWLTMMAVTAYHAEYVLSFMFVKLVAPITYSACDAVRRLGIIISGHYMFGGAPFTPLNILGITMALGGAVAFSILNH